MDNHRIEQLRSLQTEITEKRRELELLEKQFWRVVDEGQTTLVTKRTHDPVHTFFLPCKLNWFNPMTIRKKTCHQRRKV
jgi:hypothetical protein